MATLSDPKFAALVAVDLQHSMAELQLAPHSAAEVMRNSASLADGLRKAGGTVVYTRVLIAETLSPSADKYLLNGDGPPAENASDLTPDTGVQPGDCVVTKRQWGAFYGTGLEQQLRRRSIRTLVFSGIATNFGVESTAREALDRGYQVIFAEDAMSSVSAEAHEFVIKTIFPIIGHVRVTREILEGWK